MGDTLKVEEDTQGQARHTHTHTKRPHKQCKTKGYKREHT